MHLSRCTEGLAVDIRQILKKSDMVIGLRNDLRKIPGILRRRGSANVLRKYIQTHQVRKLQIGAGPIAIPGWLGTDLRAGDGVVFLDATKPFPFEDDTFDYIHSEHMIEHLTWHQGLAMLRECWRVLKPGGTIRVATPDLKVLVSLYGYRTNPLAERYMRWVTDLYLGGIQVYMPAFVINSAFYIWGHKFVYDEEVLEMTLRDAGFIDIRHYAPGESDDENLRGIEQHGRIGSGNEEMNAFQTMVFEGKCPA